MLKKVVNAAAVSHHRQALTASLPALFDGPACRPTTKTPTIPLPATEEGTTP
jgi:hypothetical protein